MRQAGVFKPTHEPSRAYDGFNALAKRLGVAPVDVNTPHIWTVGCSDGRAYDVFEIVNALLDRIDKLSLGTKE